MDERVACASRPLPWHPLHENRGRDDRDVAEGIEGQKVAIAGYDQVRMAVHGQLEKLSSVKSRQAAIRSVIRTQLGRGHQLF